MAEESKEQTGREELDQIIHRREKLEALVEAGMVAYPARPRNHYSDYRMKIGEFLSGFDRLLRLKRHVIIIGRVTSIRDHGKSMFIDLRDGSGNIQLYVSSKQLESYGQIEKLKVDTFLNQIKMIKNTVNSEEFAILAKNLSEMYSEVENLEIGKAFENINLIMSSFSAEELTTFANKLFEFDKLYLAQRYDDGIKVLRNADLGDIIMVTGVPFLTRSGHKTIGIRYTEMLAKALRPMPVVKETVDEDGNVERHDELADVELRYRQRYLDLFLNPQSRSRFTQRSRMTTAMRSFLEERGFLEVETPILQPIYGGAAAAPFTTHHNTLHIPLYLRIADELYLKRLIVGGFERVYEIGKDFRNEGMDRTHNPEFTQCELYQAYADYHDMAGIFEELCRTLAVKLTGSTVVEYQGQTLDFEQTFKRLEVLPMLEEWTGVDLGLNDEELKAKGEFNRAAALQLADEHGIELPDHAPTGKYIMELFETIAEEKGELTQPCFVMDFPADVSPLAKQVPGDSRLAERFEPYAAGMELGNAFSEQNDPRVQRKVLEEQARQRDLGDEEASVVDEDFLRALEYGMPPTGGLGIGVDRLAMLFTNAPSIQDVILFPQMRPSTPPSPSS